MSRLGEPFESAHGRDAPTATLPVSEGRVWNARALREGRQPFRLGGGHDVGDHWVDDAHADSLRNAVDLSKSIYGTSQIRKSVAFGIISAMSLTSERRENFLSWMRSNDLNLNKVSVASGVSYNTLRSYAGDGTAKLTESLSGANEAKIARAYEVAVEDIFGGPRRPNHVAAWRFAKQMMIDALADRMGVPVAYVEAIEAGEISLSPKVLAKVAEGLGEQPGLILQDPSSVDVAAMREFAGVPDTEKPRLLDMIRAYRAGASGAKTGTDG